MTKLVETNENVGLSGNSSPKDLVKNKNDWGLITLALISIALIALLISVII
jgi:hypothetical protein